MEPSLKTEFEKWVIIPVHVEASAVSQIDYKLPAHVKHCTGVAFSITDVQGAFNPSDYMGEVSLVFNNHKNHLLNFQAEYKTSRFRIDGILLKLDEPLTGGSRVSGYYRNYLAIGQSMKIYLQCIAETG